MCGNDVLSVLTIHAPGYQVPLLAYIAGDGDFPSIDTGAFLDWQRAFVDGGYLRRYAARLRELYATGRNPSRRALRRSPGGIAGETIDEEKQRRCTYPLVHRHPQAGNLTRWCDVAGDLLQM